MALSEENGRFLLLQLPCASHIVAVGKIDEHNLIMVTETDGFFYLQYAR